jgi:uncharacterized protein (UPF0305 family)
LSWIKEELNELAQYISQIHEEQLKHDGEPPTVISLLAGYNYSTALEIQSVTTIFPHIRKGGEIEIDMRKALTRYFEIYAPENDKLARYVTAISLYLTFYAKRPLHPPDLHTDEVWVEKIGDIYYCSGKSRYIDEDFSLCRYCICHSR